MKIEGKESPNEATTAEETPVKALPPVVVSQAQRTPPQPQILAQPQLQPVLQVIPAEKIDASPVTSRPSKDEPQGMKAMLNLQNYKSTLASDIEVMRKELSTLEKYTLSLNNTEYRGEPSTKKCGRCEVAAYRYERHKRKMETLLQSLEDLNKKIKLVDMKTERLCIVMIGFLKHSSKNIPEYHDLVPALEDPNLDIAQIMIIIYQVMKTYQRQVAASGETIKHGPVNYVLIQKILAALKETLKQGKL